MPRYKPDQVPEIPQTYELAVTRNYLIAVSEPLIADISTVLALTLLLQSLSDSDERDGCYVEESLAFNSLQPCKTITKTNYPLQKDKYQ